MQLTLEKNPMAFPRRAFWQPLNKIKAVCTLAKELTPHWQQPTQVSLLRLSRTLSMVTKAVGAFAALLNDFNWKTKKFNGNVDMLIRNLMFSIKNSVTLRISQPPAPQKS